MDKIEATTLRDWIDRQDSSSIRTVVDEAYPSDIADLLEYLTDDETWQFLSLLEDETASEVLSHMQRERQIGATEERDPEVVSRWLSRMSSDDRADVIKAFDDTYAQQILSRLTDRQRRETEGLAQYAEDTVGALMSTEFAAIPADSTVGEALELIRLEAPRKETIYSIYVLDRSSNLVGDISLKDLILAHPSEKIADLMDTNTPRCMVDDLSTAAAEKVKDYDLLALPVISPTGKLLGLVTVDDVIDLQEEEATDDFHKMGVVGQMKLGIRDIGLVALYRARIPWLLVLVFMNIFSGAGIAHFEETLEAVVTLVFFLPLLIDSGGNAGSQSATLMVRALALGDVAMRDWFRLLMREIVVALAIGMTMSLAVMLIASFRAPEVLVPVAITMVCTVMLGSLVGMSLPFLLTKLKRDPATASAPLITSIADIGGVLIYFSVATWWLGDAIEAARAASGG
jgi:magnesium transporter